MEAPKQNFSVDNFEEYKWDSLRDGYRLFGYDLSYPDNDIKAHLEIGYTKSPERVNPQVHERASLDFSDLEEVPLAHLNIFRPNGKGADESDMRQGRGTALLEFAMAEAAKAGAVAMYVFHSGPYMEGFLEKHGFEPVGNFYRYKKLIY